MISKYSYTCVDADRGKRLDQVLAERLPSLAGRELSKAKIRKLIVAGAVYLNRSRIRIASKPVRPGARIDVHVDWKRIEDRAPPRPKAEFSPEWILFEDDDLIAVNKPPYLPTQPTVDEARANLFHLVKSFIARRDGRPDAYVGLHHRLDRDTSGVILFTKSERANAGLAREFQEHRAQKTYLAISAVEKAPVEPLWTVKNYLAKDPKSKKPSRFKSVRSGGDPAETGFRLLAENHGVALIEARPRTGRTHQIRVHLSEEGLPILADSIYGAPSESTAPKIPRLMLHAARLELSHPVTGAPLRIESPLPEDFLQTLREFDLKYSL